MSPEKLGRYKVVREVGHGAMGVVYEAVDPNIGRKIAIKTIRTDSLGTNADEVARRFKNEARAAGSLNHPSIVTVYDADEQDGTLYLAMEFIEGSTLDAILRIQRTLSPERAIDIVRQICAGLDYAHGKGVVHRDIKPGNVMISAAGAVKITDFGIARTADAMTMTGQVLGTPNYMSPEQVLGKPLDGRSDLFSVGVVLYEMVTGERPFDGQSITTIMYKIVHETPVPPYKLDQTIHPGLSAIIEKCLAKSPEVRYRSGAELTAALQNYTMQSGEIRRLLEQPTAEMTAAIPLSAAASAGGNHPDSVSSSPAAASVGASRKSLAPSRNRRLQTIVLGLVLALIAVGLLWKHFGRNSEKNVSTSESNEEGTPAPPAVTAPNGVGEAEHPEAADGSGTPQTAIPNQSAATLRLNSNPPGAEISVDGKDTGKTTPADLQLAKGEHSVAVEMEGFQAARRQFRVKGGEQLQFSPQLSVAMPSMSVPQIPDVGKLEREGQQQRQFWEQWANNLKSGGAMLIVKCTPREAHVLVNGSDTGKTSPAVIPETPGTYTVRCEMPGFEAKEQAVTLEARKPGKVDLKLDLASQE